MIMILDSAVKDGISLHLDRLGQLREGIFKEVKKQTSILEETKRKLTDVDDAIASGKAFLEYAESFKNEKEVK